MSSIDELSNKQREVLDAIIHFIKENGYPPSIQQLCELCNVTSTSTIHHHLSTLKAKGFIKGNPAERRAITVRDDLMGSDRKKGFPILGTIAAGMPLQTVTDDTETLDLNEDLASQNCYVLRVRGESMIEDHIMDGDMVLVNPDAPIRNGDVVVALVEGETATLKRYYRDKEAGVIRLQPANATMDPIMVRETDLDLQGKVEAVVRQI